ncbi:hypothetical protein C2S53_008215 [Perilla frutescens var. hirtella]|uniref:Uncharacterized protein n=1 Tax=Perilla frutescens var. hirtella TaxID=608512 RepID=A0AAD4P3R5_PERFH|nr:hypothetical protein C2S53_008215 [Perilla frutescens var. hirtella]
MKGDEKQRKFHETLLKMMYPPPSTPLSDKEAEEQDESILMESFNDPPEDEIENEAPSQSSGDDNKGDDAGKLTRAQRKRLRKRKLKEAASRRRKIIGPLLPGSNNDVDHSRGSIEDVSNVAESVLQNAVTNVSGDHNHGSSVEVVSNVAEGVRQTAAGEEAPCSNKNKLKLKQRRKSKKMVVGKSSTPSSTDDQKYGLKIITD